MFPSKLCRHKIIVDCISNIALVHQPYDIGYFLLLKFVYLRYQAVLQDDRNLIDELFLSTLELLQQTHRAR